MLFVGTGVSSQELSLMPADCRYHLLVGVNLGEYQINGSPDWPILKQSNMCAFHYLLLNLDVNWKQNVKIWHSFDEFLGFWSINTHANTYSSVCIKRNAVGCVYWHCTLKSLNVYCKDKSSCGARILAQLGHKLDTGLTTKGLIVHSEVEQVWSLLEPLLSERCWWSTLTICIRQSLNILQIIRKNSAGLAGWTNHC